MEMNRATPRITFRLKPATFARLRKLVQASKRPQSSLIHEAIDARLAIYERQLGIGIRKAKAA